MSPELDKKLVEKYPKIFINRLGNVKETAMCWGFECGDGWYWLIDNLCNHIQSYVDSNKDTQVVADQVKEKFGSLRFYYSGGDKHQYIDGMVSHTEFLSFIICEYCGSSKNIGHTKGGWIITCCKECYEKESTLNQRNWVLDEM